MKRVCKLQLLFPETMKLLASTKKDVDQDKDGENVPKLESVEITNQKLESCFSSL